MAKILRHVTVAAVLLAAGSRTRAQPAPHDDLSLFKSKYGAPDVEDSTENDSPRPPIITRWLVYKPEHVRATYVPDVPVGTPPPYADWKLLGFQDPRNDKVLEPAVAIKRLRKRAKVTDAPANTAPVRAASTDDSARTDGGGWTASAWVVLVSLVLVVLVKLATRTNKCSACQGRIRSKRYRLSDGVLCPSCFKKFELGYGEVYGPSHTLEEVKAETRRRAALVAPATGQPTSGSEAIAPAEPQPLNALTKLQFRKYVSEQSGMSLPEVEAHLNGLPEGERQELLRSFQSGQRSSSAAQTFTPAATALAQPSPALPTCPKCRSNQTTYDKQRFGVGKAAVGAILTGGIGLLAGGIGRNKIVITCLSCGNQWKVG